MTKTKKEEKEKYILKTLCEGIFFNNFIDKCLIFLNPPLLSLSILTSP
jgi:hypothetical protein